MWKTTHGWTVVHSLVYILVTLPTSHAERSPLNWYASSNTDDGEGGEEERRECGIRNGRERERERERRRRYEEETTQQGWTVVHSLCSILVTLPTSHAERSPLN